MTFLSIDQSYGRAFGSLRAYVPTSISYKWKFQQL